MAIELNIGQNTKIAGQSLGGADLQQVSTNSSLPPILGGNSLRVKFSEMSDLEALVAKLKSESERTRFLMLMTSLSSIGQSLNEAQKSALEQGLALADKLKELESTLGGLQDEVSKEKADIALLQMQIESLQKQIDQAVQDGKDHNKLVEEQKRVRKVIDAKKDKIERTEGQIDQTKNEIASVKGKISAVVHSIGENTLKTIANELTALTPPEKAESAAEAKKEAEKIAANDPLNAIRDSLDKIERELVETIEENRIQTV